MTKTIYPLIFSAILLTCTSPKQKVDSPQASSVKIVFDTDIAGDYDDVGAMALLYAFADAGEIETGLAAALAASARAAPDAIPVPRRPAGLPRARTVGHASSRY